MKIIKYVLTLVMVLVVLIMGAMATVLIVVDPNDYKPQIIEFANQASGRELSIPGELKLSVFPWIGLQLGEARLSNAPGFKANNFVKLEGVDIKVAFMPLLRGEVSVGVVRLKGLEVNLARKKDGSSNWDDLLANIAAEEQPSAAKPASKSDDGAAPQIGPIEIGGVEIINANVHWQDAVDNMRVDLERLNFKTGVLELYQPIDFKTDFTLKNHSPDIVLKASLSARIMADKAFEKIDLENLAFDFDINEKDILGGQQKLTGTANIGLNLATQQYRVNQLNLKTDLQGQALPGGRLSMAVETSLTADLDKQTADIKPTRINVLGLDIQTQLQATQILGDVAAKGELRIDTFSPKALLEKLAMSDLLPVTADPTVLQAVKMGMTFSGNLESVNVTALKLKLDDTTITGTMGISQFTQKPAHNIKLAMDAIDLDRYLPPALEEAELQAAGDAPPMTGDEPIELPLALMRDLNVDGLFRIGRLKIMNMKVTEFTAGIHAKDGVIDLTPMNVDLYEGRYRGSAQLDVRQVVPKYRIDIDLDEVQSEPLLDDFMQESPVIGMMNLQASLQTQGGTVNKLKQGLNGSAHFEFKNGALKGFNIAEKMREVQAKLKREDYAPNPGAKRTDFAEFYGGMTIKNGVATFTETNVAAPALRGSLMKQVNLVTEQLDVRAEIHVVDTKTGQDGKELDELKDLFIPLDITGPFTDPKIKLDFKAMLNQQKLAELDAKKEALRAELEAEKEKARAELKAKEEAARQKLEAEKKALAEKKAEAKKKLEEAERKRKAELEQKKAEEKAKLEAEKKRKEEELKKKLEAEKKKLLERLRG